MEKASISYFWITKENGNAYEREYLLFLRPSGGNPTSMVRYFSSSTPQ